MPAIRNSKRERWCLLVAQGAKHREAAEQVGYRSPSVQGAQLAANPELKARIAELSGLMDREKCRELVRHNLPTRDYVLAELMDNVQAAKAASDRSNVNKGLELVGREIGMFVQRSMQVESPLARLPADRLLALLRLVDNALGMDQEQSVVSASATVAVPEPVTIEAEPAQDW